MVHQDGISIQSPEKSCLRFNDFTNCDRALYSTSFFFYKLKHFTIVECQLLLKSHVTSLHGPGGDEHEQNLEESVGPGNSPHVRP